MKFIVDSREQTPYLFKDYPDVSTEVKALNAGDYSIAGFEDKIALERKELNDLINCLKGKERERFERELAKAKSYEIFAVIVECNLPEILFGRYRSDMKPKSVIASLSAFTVRYGVQFIFTGTRRESEFFAYSLLSKFGYEIEKRYKILSKAG